MTGDTDVETHEAFAAGAEHFSVVESQSRFIYEEGDESVMIQAESSAVEPYEK